MAGVMVVYHPPITHLPPPAVGASPDAAIHTMFKLRTLNRTFSPRLVGLGSGQAGVRGGREGAWEHFFRISEASVGRGGPLRASLSSTESSARQSAVLGPLSVLGRARLACTPPWHVGRTTYPRTPR